ncbi:sulfatase family protein [Catellatospora tritici]|uniref:sulfatase family protein n=1 Tax=Catellatospora tritici TaxID=2851566 RepID=UPI001C2D3BFB|nr:sulfatase [Catellatospora tritici]MBV1854506.1 sulfatase [Catellatospora tritici]
MSDTPSLRRRSFLAASAAAGVAAATGLPAQPANAAAARPNILVIVTDDQPKNTQWATPQTIGWLGDHGTTFANAFSVTPLCAPSRSTIFTGQYAHNHGVRGNQHQENLNHHATVQRYLQEAGYRTGLYGKYLNGWDVHDNPPYFDEFALLAPITYNDGQYNVNGTVQTINGYSTTVVKNRALQFIQRSTTDTRPWFLYVAPKAPHGPNTPDVPYADTEVPAWDGRPGVPENDRADKPTYIKNADGTLADGKNIRTAQLRTLLSVDDAVQAIHDKLEALGQLQNTLVFFISDNGFAWGDHGWTKKSVPYGPAIEVPFRVSWPAGGLNAGVTDNRLTGNIDIAPTILDAAGITPDSQHPQDGHSLLGSYRRDHILTEFFKHGTAAGGPPSWSSYVTATKQYTEYRDVHTDANGIPTGTGAILFREYYDLVNDPHQLTNLLYQATPAQETALGIPALATQLAADRTSAGPTAP